MGSVCSILDTVQYPKFFNSDSAVVSFQFTFFKQRDARVTVILDGTTVWRMFTKSINKKVVLYYCFCFQGMKMKKHEELETPTFTTSIPVKISVDD